MPASLDRNILPSIAPIKGEVQLRGHLYRRLKGGYQLDDGVTVVKSWPVASVGLASCVPKRYLLTVFPYQLRLDQDSQGALETGWVTVAVQPLSI